MRFPRRTARLCQELVFGMVRWQRTLDWLVARKTAGRDQNATVRLLLHLGLYQLFWLQRIPDHAAVHETVELGKRLGFGPRAGFLNAVLRGFIREREQTQTIALEALKASRPGAGLFPSRVAGRAMAGPLGREQTRRLLEWNNSPAAGLCAPERIENRPRRVWRPGGRRRASNSRSGNGIGPGRAWSSNCARHPPLAACASFQEGLFYVQDPSTLLAVEQLGPRPGETILDLCAAPGGKTTFIAQRMQQSRTDRGAGQPA